MKLVKSGFVLFVIGILLSMINVGAVTWAPVKLGALKKVYTSNTYEKTKKCTQGVKGEAVDTWSGDARIIEAQTNREDLGTNALSGKIEVAKDYFATWGSDNVNTYAGNYSIRLNAKKSTLSEANFWGSWALDYTGW